MTGAAAITAAIVTPTGGDADMAASVTGFFASVINIAQIRPSVWVQPEFRQLARSSPSHGAFGRNSVAEVFVARFDERR